MFSPDGSEVLQSLLLVQEEKVFTIKLLHLGGVSNRRIMRKRFARKAL